MDFSSLPEEQELSAWFEFSPGFELRIRYLSPEEFDRALRRARKSARRDADLDGEVLTRKAADLILDWRGLTPEAASLLVNLKVPEDAVFECTEANKVFLLKNAYRLEGFVTEAAMNLAAMREARRVEELKNSERSPAGS